MIARDLLVGAYATGWFPMAVGQGDIRWYSPDPRGIIPLDHFHVPTRLQRVIRRQPFRIEIDTAFPAVIGACASVPRREDEDDEGGTWIDEEIVES